jgi:hypothetical protein
MLTVLTNHVYALNTYIVKIKYFLTVLGFSWLNTHRKVS